MRIRLLLSVFLILVCAPAVTHTVTLAKSAGAEFVPMVWGD